MTADPVADPDVIESPPRRALIAAHDLEDLALGAVTGAALCAAGGLYATGQFALLAALNAAALAWALAILILRPPWTDDEEDGGS